MKTVTWELHTTTAQKEELVMQSEAALRAQWDDMIDRFTHSDCRIYTLSGPTCSGKTTTAHLLVKAFSEIGKRVAVISIDDFFHSRPSVDERTNCADADELDYDSIHALDLDCFAKCARLICEGKDCEMPLFNFHNGQRDGYRTLKSDSYDIALFEGIQAIYPEITAILRPYGITEIAIGVQEDVCVNGAFFDRRQIRLMRRLVRDYRKRSAPTAFTLALWNSVSRNEDQNIFPHEHTANVRINSFLPYEVFVLRDSLIPLLESIEPSHDDYGTAQELLQKLLPLPSFSESLVPKDSMFWEFL